MCFTSMRDDFSQKTTYSRIRKGVRFSLNIKIEMDEQDMEQVQLRREASLICGTYGK